MLVAVAVLLCSLAQPPEVAPAPHPALDELVKEYRYWGLPLPAADAQLVRLKRFRVLEEEPHRTWPAFRNRPTRPGEPPRPPTGDEWAFDNSLVEDAVLDRPTAADAEAVDTAFGLWLRFSVAFRLRGWDDAAAAVYARARKDIAEEKVEDGEQPLTVLRVLRGRALGHWYARLTERDSDRREVLKRLRELTRLEPDFLTPSMDRTLRDLELALAPRKGKPGTVEALIDELTDDWGTWWGWHGLPPDGAAYWKLAERGFDAVPALIEHLTDERLTRVQFTGLNNFWPYTYRVNHLASALLSDLSGGQLRWWDLRGDTVNPGEALKWWGTAREVSEERWLVDHALPAAEADKPIRPNVVILRALRAKYPHRLGDVYRAILLKRHDVASDGLAAEVAASTLPRERKLALLEAGASHAEPAHRRAALAALLAVDPAAFRKHFVRTVEAFPAELPPRVQGSESEDDIAGVVWGTADRACWDALLAAARRAAPDSRLRLIDGFGWAPEPAAPGRRECVRYLLAFRHDAAAGELRDEPWAVRDLAATQLAYLLGAERPLAFELPTGPRERALFRERVWEAAEHELRRGAT